jgi:transposase InsO family protein
MSPPTTETQRDDLAARRRRKKARDPVARSGDPWPLTIAASDPSGVCSMAAAVGHFVLPGPSAVPDTSRWQQCPEPTWTPSGGASVDTRDYVPAVDDCTRLAYAEVLHNHKAPTVVAFLRRAVQFFARHGVTVERVLTDNGSSYCATIHALACRALGIRHLRTRPYRSQTNGKAERFIRTLSSAAGRTAPSTAAQPSAPPPSTAGSGTTTTNQDTQPSAPSPRSHASTSERTNLPRTYT